MGYGLRYTFSAVTSASLALVLLLLPYVPPQYAVLHYIAVAVFLLDALVKLLDITSVRDYLSAAYSVVLALLLLTYFKLFGTPVSELAALLFLYDAYLKLRAGEQRTVFGIPETKFRHVLSAIVTTMLGLGIMFDLVLPFSLHFLLGLLVLVDGVVKLEYADIL